MRGDVTIEPNPALEGGLTTITVPQGEGPWYVSVDGSGELIEIHPDANGQAETRIPGRGGETFTVTDGKVPPTEGNFDIASTNE